MVVIAVILIINNKTYASGPFYHSHHLLAADFMH